MKEANTDKAPAFSALTWLVFLISPFLAFWVALTNYRTHTARNVVWACCIFYGLVFNIVPGQSSDCVRYAEELRQMHLTGISWELLSSTFYQKGQMRFDIYQPILTLLVSRFTNDYHFLFAVFGIPLGFFYSRTIWFFVDRLPLAPTLTNALALVATAFILNPGSALNGVRMYTAFYAFAFFALKYFDTNRLSYLALAATAVLIHFSFVYPFALLVVVPIAEKLPGLTISTFTFSFFTPALENTTISDLLGFLPGFQQRVAGYLVDPDARVQDVGWLPTLSRQGNIAFVVASAYLLPPLLRKLNDRALLRIGILATLIFTGVNIFWNVYSFGRFADLSLLLFCGVWATSPPRSHVIRIPHQLFGIALLLLLLPTVAIGVRMFLGYVSIGLLLANPLTFTWFYDSKQSAYDFLLLKLRPW